LILAIVESGAEGEHSGLDLPSGLGLLIVYIVKSMSTGKADPVPTMVTIAFEQYW
jgi:hypothetical protein